MSVHHSHVRRAAAAAALLAIPVAAQALVHPGWMEDGRAGHLLFAVTQAAGWSIVLDLVLRLRAGADRRHWSSRLVVLGCALQVLFAAAYAVAAAAWGEPHGAVWPLFLAGFLGLTVGGVAWGRRLRRDPGRRLAGTGLLVVALSGFLAMALGMDPFHDIFLLASYAAWIVVGLGFAGGQQSDRLEREEEPGRWARA